MSLPDTYHDVLADIKSRVKTTQISSLRKVNSELVLLYFEIGRILTSQMEEKGWRPNVILSVSEDLIKEFGKGSGYSPRNLKYMVKFYKTYKDKNEVQQAAALIPWFHNCIILDKTKDQKERLFYLNKSYEHGWSRSVLDHQIDMKLYQRSLPTPQTNFDLVLSNQSDQAKELIKDEYILELLGTKQELHERELEQSILENIKAFLLELGSDFCFIGNQYKILLEDEANYIDLLFFQRELKCLFAIELKTTEFKPEYVGKMNYYLSLLDDKVKKTDENASVGIILCKTKNSLKVEYALRDSPKPIAVATYRIVEKIEKKLLSQK